MVIKTQAVSSRQQLLHLGKQSRTNNLAGTYIKLRKEQLAELQSQQAKQTRTAAIAKGELYSSNQISDQITATAALILTR